MTTRHQEHLDDIIRRLERRVQALERALQIKPGEIALVIGNSSLTMKNNTAILESKNVQLMSEVLITQRSQSIYVESEGKIHLTANGDIVLKGANIIQN